MKKIAKKRSPIRRSTPPAPQAVVPAPGEQPKPGPDQQTTLRLFLEVLRLPVRPPRGMMDFVTRMAFWSFLLVGTVLATNGRAGLLVAHRIVDFLGVLLAVGAADQWVVGLARWIGRHWRR